MLIAHKSEDGREQPFAAHAWGVAELAAEHASQFGGETPAKLAGLMHDVGKCVPAGQRRLRGDPHKVEHSAAGAEQLEALGGTAARLLAYCVAGHHAGLPDGGLSSDTENSPTLRGKLKRQRARAGDYLSFLQEIGESAPAPALPALAYDEKHRGFSLAFWARMIFSCLVDADFLDTEAFMYGQPPRERRGADMQTLLERLLARLARFSAPADELGFRRRAVQEDCLRAAHRPRGLFTLTVPTGGGKTLSSLAFALSHALEHGLRRVIYVIPYTSIIEQTADVFREALGGDSVLEHHSNVTYERDDEETDFLRLAAENWDLPIIVTTNVQFFESLFANKTSRCRKLHSIANSVIIFDEAQMLPPDFLAPCVRAIEELVRNYRCTAVLCSATQPALESLFSPALRATEICSEPEALYEALRRVRFVHMGEADTASLAARLHGTLQALCVVNTRAEAQKLYEALEGEGKFHLSTLMTPLHRARTLATIRARLKNGLPCRVVSTSLIEAGVDVDFPCVIRAEASIDSLVQAAGRCNREGRLAPDDAVVYVYRPEADYAKKCPALIKMQVGIAEGVWTSFPDIAAPAAIRAYFKRLLQFRADAADAHKILPALDACAKNGLMIPFAQVAETFKIIGSTSFNILIQKDEPRAREIAAALRAAKGSRELLREAGQYTVSVYERQYRALYNRGALEPIMGDLAVLNDDAFYSQDMGLIIAEDGGQALFS